MKAMTAAHHGGPEAIQLQEVPTPSIGDDEGPRPSRAPGGNLGATFQMLGRLVRLISGDSRWNVELVRGHDLANRRDSTIRATGRTKADAVDAAVRLIGELQAGKAGPDQHSTA